MTEFSMWDAPAEEISAARTADAHALAAAAVEPLWPYLSKAASDTEFAQRLALSSESVERLVGQVGLDAEASKVATETLEARWQTHSATTAARDQQDALARQIAAGLAGEKTSAQWTTPHTKCKVCGDPIEPGGAGTWHHWKGDPDSPLRNKEHNHEAVPTEKTSAKTGSIRWTSDTHMGVGYLVGLGPDDTVYEVYLNPNFNPTPCSWVQYGPEGDTGLNSGIAEGRGFKTMQEAVKDAEAHAAGSKTSAKTAGSRCPSCGEYDLNWVPVRNMHTNETFPDPENPGEVLTAQYCSNCDYGTGSVEVEWNTPGDEYAERAMGRGSAKTAAGEPSEVAVASLARSLRIQPGDVWEVYQRPNASEFSLARYLRIQPEDVRSIRAGLAQMAREAGKTAADFNIEDTSRSEWQAEMFGKPKTRTVDGVTVHEFDTTDRAYNESQVNDAIKDGDVLWVPSEGVAGVMVEAWPTAVTTERGAFHGLSGGYTFETIPGGSYVRAAEVARKISKGKTSAKEATYTPTGETYEGQCDTCRKPVAFQWLENEGGFRTSEPVESGAGSDHLGTWCPEHSPRRRASKTAGQGGNYLLGGVSFRTDKDGAIGWMEDWGAIYDQDWLGKGWVVSEPHNSGGLGGASYRLTERGLANARHLGEGPMPTQPGWETFMSASRTSAVAALLAEGASEEEFLSAEGAFFHHPQRPDAPDTSGRGEHADPYGDRLRRMREQDSRERAGERSQQESADKYWAQHPEEHERHLRQNASRSAVADLLNPEVPEDDHRSRAVRDLLCDDEWCDDDLLAMNTGTEHPDVPRFVPEHLREHVRATRRQADQREHDNGETIPCPNGHPAHYNFGEKAWYCATCGWTGAKKTSVNENAYGTERYQTQPDIGRFDWVHDDWEEGKADQKTLDQGRAAHEPDHPFAKSLTTVREAALRLLADAGDNLEGFEQSDDFADAGGQPQTTRPRVMPSQHQTPRIDNPPVMQPPGQVEMGSFDAAPAPGFGVVDPMMPTPEQMVAARVARIAARVRVDNPTLTEQQATALAARTVAAYPEMVKAGGIFDPAPKPGQHIHRGGLSGEIVATITKVLGRYGDGWVVETSPNIEAIPGDGVVVTLSGIASNEPYWQEA